MPVTLSLYLSKDSLSAGLLSLVYSLSAGILSLVYSLSAGLLSLVYSLSDGLLESSIFFTKLV